ncbi:MAG: FAD-dependent oxidoreductase, partial [Candidatus Hodarchaeota archaeon]
MKTEKFDVTIVGAGPTGTIAAERLASEGVQVFLCDRQEFPRYKCCAAGVLWHDIEDFPEIKPVIENYNHAMIAHPPSLSREFKIESQEHYIMGQTYRSTLDNHLAILAKKSGADFRDNTRVDDMRL